MSQKIHSAAQEAARRVGGLAVLGVAIVMASLSEQPFLSLEAGGISALLVTFVLLLLAARVESRLPSGEPWQTLSREERLPAERARTLIANARRRALHTHALFFATAAAVMLAVEIAGEVHLRVYSG